MIVLLVGLYKFLLHGRVYRIEKNTLTPTKYMFPNFEPLHWFAAQHILDSLRGKLALLNVLCLQCVF